ncbi:uncharacterized protein [Phyllobates terribilis]|uniref:uncharacterized protein n=1 Tax=Phyllobates terribilis TaxID=111132 RepID=UPI003CCA9874
MSVLTFAVDTKINDIYSYVYNRHFTMLTTAPSPISHCHPQLLSPLLKFTVCASTPPPTSNWLSSTAPQDQPPLSLTSSPLGYFISSPLTSPLSSWATSTSPLTLPSQLPLSFYPSLPPSVLPSGLPHPPTKTATRWTSSSHASVPYLTSLTNLSLSLTTTYLHSLRQQSPLHKLAYPRRNLKHLDLHSFSESLLPLTDISSLNDADVAATLYNTTTAAALDSVTPLTHTKARTINRQPWHTSLTKELRRASRVAERRWKRSHSNEHFIAFKQSLTTAKSTLTAAKQTYFSSLISSLSHNPKQLFNTFNSLLRPPVPPPSPLTSAEDFASFFKQKIDTIRQSFCLKPPQPRPTPTQPSSSKTTFSTITEDQLSSLLSKSHLTTCKLDPIPSHLMPNLTTIFIPPLAHLLN